MFPYTSKDTAQYMAKPAVNAGKTILKVCALLDSKQGSMQSNKQSFKSRPVSMTQQDINNKWLGSQEDIRNMDFSINNVRL